MRNVPPQPAVGRLTDFHGHPIIVGIVEEIPELLVATAASLASATGGTLHFAYVDPQRYTVEEMPDGTVRHAALSPDSLHSNWQDRESALKSELQSLLENQSNLPWQFHYLAGRPDRALTHLARAINAAVFVIGTRAPGPRARIRRVLEGSVAYHLAQHQHRPVLSVPLSVVDWKEAANPWDR